jgi:AraC-like DNA-binding protein
MQFPDQCNDGVLMPVLPIPMFVALVLAFLLLRAIISHESHVMLLLLIAACAGQSAIIALVQYYGISALRPVQPVTATFIPPLAWLAFTAVARKPLVLSRDYLHALGPIFTLFCSLFAPATLDVIIPVLFAGYGAMILIVLSKGEDSLPHSPLESGGVPLLVWRVIAISLLASACSDVLITLNFLFGRNTWNLVFVGGLQAISMLTLGALSLSHAIDSRRDVEMDSPEPATEVDAAQEAALMERLDDLMARQKPYLDPDLTLSRLGRKLIAPAKNLSAAINRSKGENVSRYINRHRIEHACSLITNGTSITTAMLESGFNTKSNFNREFLRLKMVSPSELLAMQTYSKASAKTRF